MSVCCLKPPSLCTVLQQLEQIKTFLFCQWFRLFIYLTERDTATKRGNTSSWSGRGRSRLPVEQGVWSGAPSQDTGIMPWTEGGRLMTEPPRCPKFNISKNKYLESQIPFLPQLRRWLPRLFSSQSSLRFTLWGGLWTAGHQAHALSSSP